MALCWSGIRDYVEVNHQDTKTPSSDLASWWSNLRGPVAIVGYWLKPGLTVWAFALLPDAGQVALRRDLESLYDQHNVATGGTTNIAAEYLDVFAARN